MENVLFLSSTEVDGTLSKPALEALTAALQLSQQLRANLTVGLFGASTQSAADSIESCGAQRFLSVQGENFSQARYASDAAACEALAKGSDASIVIAPQISRMARVMPGVAYRLQGEADTHITGFAVANEMVNVNRCFYRQRIEATLARSTRPWILLIEPSSFAPWSGVATNAPVEEIEVVMSENLRRTVITGIVTPPAEQQTIRPDAKLLFVAGAGWTKKQRDGQPHLVEAETAILKFLRNTHASLGGSKSLVDLSGEGQAVLGFMSHLNQVGQTGSTPRHPKGLSTCCHGEEPHVVGWRFISDRRAVNLDPNCGWARGKADVLYVADAFEVMAKVNAILAAEDQPAAETANAAHG
jgi:electron transfer flavoprotein alpha subunit